MQVKADPGADNIFQRYKDRKSFETKSTTWEVDPGKFTHMDSLNELRAFDRQLDTPKLDDPNTPRGRTACPFPKPPRARRKGAEQR